MTFPPVHEQLDLLIRGCEHIYSLEELERKVKRSYETKQPLRAKLGLDPTAPDIHLGHTVVLRKMRHFQDLGHKAILILGDYTARIGDPSGKNKTRPVLDETQVDRNAKTYFEQAGKILDLDPGKIEIRRNSEWLAPLQFADALKLAGKMTVARMLERDTFSKRHKEGKEIYIHEFLYPLMQGYDSVAIRSDVELGGTDQTFNNLVGRDLQRDAGQEPQVVMILPILAGLDGVEKMSKSLGNYVGVTESAGDMFGKLMSIPDGLMRQYFELLTNLPEDEIRKLVDPAKSHPRDAKVAMAIRVTEQFCGSEAAQGAKDEFFRIHGAGKTGLPDDMEEIVLTAGQLEDGQIGAAALVVACGFAETKAEARRLIEGGGVRLNQEAVQDAMGKVSVQNGAVVQRGKRKFVRLRIGSRQ
jgi:tyrosyl-tRNA synthetase